MQHMVIAARAPMHSALCKQRLIHTPSSHSVKRENELKAAKQTISFRPPQPVMAIVVVAAVTPLIKWIYFGVSFNQNTNGSIDGERRSTKNSVQFIIPLRTAQAIKIRSQNSTRNHRKEKVRLWIINTGNSGIARCRLNGPILAQSVVIYYYQYLRICIRHSTSFRSPTTTTATMTTLSCADVDYRLIQHIHYLLFSRFECTMRKQAAPTQPKCKWRLLHAAWRVACGLS